MINVRFVSQYTIRTKGRVQKSLEPCRLVVIGDGKKGGNFGTIDIYFEGIIAVSL